jgi:hypothetical protein
VDFSAISGAFLDKRLIAPEVNSVQRNKERWVELCEQAAVEQDSKKLVALTQEINRLLREKQDRLDNARKTPPKDDQSKNSN